MMASGSAVQTKGLGLWLCSARYRLMAAWRSTSEWNTPRLRRRLESLAKNPSTALSQEAEVGVKWKVQRGSRRPFCRPRFDPLERRLDLGRILGVSLPRLENGSRPQQNEAEEPGEENTLRSSRREPPVREADREQGESDGKPHVDQG